MRRIKTIGAAAIGGALLGLFYGGPIGAVIGASAGTYVAHRATK